MIAQLAGNGRVLLALNDAGEWNDLFFPYPGQFQHLREMRLGLYDVQSSEFHWLRPGNGFSVSVPPSVVGSFPASVWSGHGVTIAVEEIVHPNHDLVLRILRVCAEESRRLRLFSYQSFNIAESLYQETAYVDPTASSLVHYKRGFYFEFFGDPPFDAAVCGEHTLKGLKGTYVDAEDGRLDGRTIAHGAADSVMQWNLDLTPPTEATIRIFLAVGRGGSTVHRLRDDVRARGPERFEVESKAYWRAWAARHLPARPDDLGDEAARLGRESVLVLKLSAGSNGSIIASPDTRSLVVGGDTYNYCWWRDGGYISQAMDISRLRELSARFLRFARACQSPDGSFAHRYFPDGEVGSTWHPPPFLQIDQTATVISATWHHLEHGADPDVLLELWPMVKSAANFLVEFRDRATGLPSPSFDLWEERWGIHAYSAAAVAHGLDSAARIAEVLGKDVARWQTASEEVRERTVRSMWDSGLSRFVRSLDPRDERMDASILLALDLGLLEPSDPRYAETVEATERRLWSKNIGGLARYEGDEYYGHENPWVVCTLWLAATQLKLGHRDRCRELIDWAVAHATPTGLLPEQIDSVSGEPKSATPLVWSHATFLDLVDRYRRASNPS
ncbi:MAG TPA: glycoside hydrolase family 15 protein [Thermoplasmata archaeon]|nr:glycoside hydrolase family 15 protein [Thermoplasmata archaeon]